ncbi:MAG: hypothetical protein ACRDGG_07160 [Anaerolineae bacterium]
MSTAIQIETTILPGGRIEISAPELIPGRPARVFVIVEEEQVEKRFAVDILAEAPGHRLFKTAEEVDAYIREERDSWER